MNLSHRTDMSNDPREQRVATQAELDAAIAAQRAERIRNGIHPDTGRFLDDGLTARILEHTLSALDIPGVDIIRIPQPSPVKASMPEPLTYYERQAEESTSVEEVADQIAHTIYGVTLTSQLGREEQHKCRSAATLALRRLHPGWVKAAQEAAVDAGVFALQTEGGFVVRSLPEAKLETLARTLVGRIVAAYFGVTEGTAPVLPGAYLRIVEGSTGE